MSARSSAYALLGLSFGASPEEIKKSYRMLAMRWHPDRNAGSEEATEKFKALHEAYALLTGKAAPPSSNNARAYAHMAVMPWVMGWLFMESWMSFASVFVGAFTRIGAD